MTPTLATHLLYAAMLRNPDELDIRLRWADYLDEQDSVRVTCPKCAGARWVTWRTRTAEMDVDEYGLSSSRCDCEDGTVIDSSNADRAELIRLQIKYIQELGNFNPEHVNSIDMYLDPDDGDQQLWKHRILGMRKRERELLAAHPDWSCQKCPDCGSKRMDCLTCRGIDLLETWEYVGSGPPKERTLTWHAGYPSAVSCNLAELGAEDHSMTGKQCFIPSAWAKRVVEALPVTRFTITDRVPTADQGDPEPTVGWFSGPGPGNTGYMMQHVLTPVIWGAIDGPKEWGGRWKLFKSSQLALSALATACGSLVRSHVYGIPR